MELFNMAKLNEEMDEIVPVATRESGEPEYAEYIKNGFLNSFLSESYNDVVDVLTNLKLSDTINESNVCDALVSIEMSNLGSAAKLEAMQKVVDLYAETVQDDMVNEDVVMLEYAGNPEKNKILRKLMQEMESRLAEYYEEIDFVITSLDQIASVVKKEATKGKKANAKSAAFAAKEIYDKVDKKLASKESTEYIKRYNTTFAALKKICKSFSVKFNDVVVDDKKAFDVKLEAAVKKVRDNKKFTKWLPNYETGYTEAIKDFNGDLDALSMDSGEQVDNIIRYVNPIYRYAYGCLTGYIGNINYIRRILGLEKVNTIFYKILNKVFKTKKED